MDSKKYEKLIALIINENEEAAKALLHDIVVEKSREIYENLMGEEELSGEVGSLMDEIEDESFGMNEQSDEIEIDTDMQNSDEMTMDKDSTSEPMGIEDEEVVSFSGGEENIESRLDSIEDGMENIDDKISRLLADFEQKMNGTDMADEVDADAEEADADAEEADADAEEDDADADEADADMADLDAEEDEDEEEEKLAEAKLTPVRRPANVSPAVNSPTRTKPGVETKGRPVHMGGVGPGTGRLATAQSSGMSYQNAGGGHAVKQHSAPKPQMRPAGDSGAKSPLGSVKISNKASR